MATPPSLDGTRLFARIHAVDFECPRCGRIHAIRHGRRAAGWNARTGTLACSCRMVLQLGVLIYPTQAGNPPHRQIPEDWVPNPRQAAALRQLQAAILLDDTQRRTRSTVPRNRRGPACTCLVERTSPPGVPAQLADYRTVRHPNCAVHAGRAAGPRSSVRTDNPPSFDDLGNPNDFENE